MASICFVRKKSNSELMMSPVLPSGASVPSLRTGQEISYVV